MNPELIKIYKEETRETLESMEQLLIELEANQEDEELIHGVFRGIHSIKGSSNMFGYDAITAFTHDIENVLDQVRQGTLKINKQLISLLFQTSDVIKKMLNEENVEEQVKKSILDYFKDYSTKQHTSLISDSQANKTDQTAEQIKEPDPINNNAGYYNIHFSPDPQLLMNGTNLLGLLQELSELGDYQVQMNTQKIPTLNEINPFLCYGSWDILLYTKKNIDDIKDIFIFVEHLSDISIKQIEPSDHSNQKILSEENTYVDLPPMDSMDKVQNEDTVDHPIPPDAIENQTEVSSVLETQKKAMESNGKDELKAGVKKDRLIDNSIRVSTIKLDKLVDLVGELVIVEERLNLLAKQEEESVLYEISEEIKRITDELRDNTLSIRMLPIAMLFNKFKRMVRDLSMEFHKEVNLILEGAETELDKTIIERLNDPLIHLIRNSVDHGIEKPNERAQNGKDRTGSIKLSAFHTGANVIIQIKDDGAGMDVNAIRTKALQQNLIPQEDKLSDKEILQLIFAPGFSTAQHITSVSGRGVGMDVVKKGIESIGGTVEISTQKGIGTTISIKLPLTLAIIDGLLVKVNNQKFIFPLSSIIKCIEHHQDHVENGWYIIRNMGELIPYIRLREWQMCFEKRPKLEYMVITKIQNEKVGFVVDDILGEHQTVIKSLGKVFSSLKGISGASILGDGSMALILDVQQLMQLTKGAVHSTN